MRLQFSGRYLAYFLLLFFAEVFIAIYVNDNFIRPYAGDFLVVILLYCMIKSVLSASKAAIAVSVLLFSYVLETLQYFSIVEILGLENYPLANVVIGTSFAWMDMLAYTLGIITVLIAERKIPG